MKKITESQLVNLSKGLKERLAEMGPGPNQTAEYTAKQQAAQQPATGPNGQPLVKNAQGQLGYMVRAGRSQSFVPYTPPNQQTAQHTTATTTPQSGQKQLLPVNPNVKAYQDALVKAGVALPKYGADGRWGTETATAAKDPKAAEINKQFADKVPQLKGIAPQSGETEVLPAENPTPAVDPQKDFDDRMAVYQNNQATQQAIASVKQYIKPKEQVGRLQTVIDPKSGILYYGKEDGQPQPMPLDFMKQPAQQSLADALTKVGLQVTSTPEKSGDSWWGKLQQLGPGYAMVDPAKLASLGQAPAQQTTTPQAGQAASNNTDPTKGPVNYSLGTGMPNPGQGLKMPTKESVGYDELARLTSLIHYR